MPWIQLRMKHIGERSRQARLRVEQTVVLEGCHELAQPLVELYQDEAIE